MFQSSILDFTLQALILVLMLSMPSILVAALTGLLVSFLQALTQIQEQTLAFAIKLIGVTITIALTAGWLGGEIYNFALQLFTTFPTLVQ
ncbi:type III secretion system export apparatus subunit SctS [Halodesulfovibrio sp.]|uniref:type III secretion system export apparatus subunit SctS n=1 Tax=Halodesulfovibrio sp. TaxID=1912772 RepID=UPI0025C515C7|nr:type III secretion system export apparatus subunit SctS [Halodesulfovibrio sp.]